MVERTKCGMSRVWFYHLVMVTFVVVVGLISSANILQAQELSEEMMMTAMVQYTLKYRFDNELKVGDWIEYQLLDEGEKPEKTKIKVTGKGKGGVWIEEKMQGQEFHMLMNLDNMKLLDGYMIDAEGNKETAQLLSDEQLAQAISMIEQMRQQGMRDAQIIEWEKGEGEEKVEVPAGGFTCIFLEPVFSEEYIKQATDYGLIVDEMKQESRIYFNEEIPRLLPMQFALGWIFYVETFDKIKGGMVECKHMKLHLVDYGKE